MRQKIDYGIDLGTTNSAIARMESGEATILKSDDNQMDTTPSCISFNKKKMMFVGQNAKNAIEAESASAFRSRRQSAPNGYYEFKRTMGTDHKYESTHMGYSYTSEELSAEVLKKLRGYVRDEEVGSVVITVPAMFKQNQIDATQRAAELAGFKYCELLQEPIAASIAYGVKVNAKIGYWLVFDFGGGTFDVALMHVDDGIMKVIDTEGDNHLGGKNLDAAIVDHLFIPEIEKQFEINDEVGKRLLQDALKTFAEKAKIELSSKSSWKYYLDDFGTDDNGEEVEIELTISLKQYESVCGPIFQNAIDICKQLLDRNKLSGDDLQTIILVGGPTFSQTLRRMLKEQISSRIDTTVDPMTAVAKGAALFASTKNIPIDLQKRDTKKAQLTLKYPETTVETHENLGIRIDRKKSTTNLPSPLSIEVIRSDCGWSSGKMLMDGDAEIIEVLLNNGKANQFDIKLFGPDSSMIPCEPSSITIIHGLKIANPTLPLSIGMELYDTGYAKQGVYAFAGLEKNKSLPAKGKGIYKTAKDIRPGNRTDKFTIQFYDFVSGSDGSRAIFNNLIGGTTVTGEKLPALLPAQSEVELTLSVDASRRFSLSIYIPTLDETIEVIFESGNQKSEDVSILFEDIQEALDLAEDLETSSTSSSVADLKSNLRDIENILNARGDDADTRFRARDKLQKTFIELDKIKSANIWPELEDKLDAAMSHLMVNNERYGDEKSQRMVLDYQKRVQDTKTEKNCNAGNQLLDEINSFNFALVSQDIGLWMSLIKECDQDFETTEWSDKREARRILNEAKTMIATNPSKAKLEEAVRNLLSLMPREKRKASQRTNDELLRR